MIEYPIGSSGQVIVLADAVLHCFARSRQLRRSQTEAGGQLFARFDASRIIVEEATGPRPSDRRTRTSFVPDRTAEQQEILDRHVKGLHYVGDWHTHPDSCPIPSSVDLSSIAECVLKSEHTLNGFVLIIVGQNEPPDGLHVSIHDGSAFHRLMPGQEMGRAVWSQK